MHHIRSRIVRLYSLELGRKPEHETLRLFPCKVAAAGDEKYFVCVCVGVAAVFCNECVFMCA